MKIVAITLLSLAALTGAEIYAPPAPIGVGFAPPGGSVIGGPSGGVGPGGIGATLSGPGSVTVGFTSGPGGISVGGSGSPGSGGGLGFAPAAPGNFLPPSGVGFAPGAPGSSSFAPASTSFTPGLSASFAPPPRVPASTYGPPGF